MDLLDLGHHPEKTYNIAAIPYMTKMLPAWLLKAYAELMETDPPIWVVLNFTTYRFQDTISCLGLRRGGGPSLHGQ